MGRVPPPAGSPGSVHRPLREDIPAPSQSGPEFEPPCDIVARPPQNGVTGLDSSLGTLFANAEKGDTSAADRLFTLLYELWRSDGTTEGTALAQDIAAGALDSRPQRFRVKGSRTFFLADDGFAGYELWVARTAILMNRPAQAIQDLRGDVVAIGLPHGLAASLLAPLDTAARALQAGRSVEAITALDAFAQRAGSLTPRWISETAATNLREFAAETIRLLRPPLMPE